MNWKTTLRPLIGTAICGISALAFSIINVIVKHLRLSPFVKIWFSCLLNHVTQLTLKVKTFLLNQLSMCLKMTIFFSSQSHFGQKMLLYCELPVHVSTEEIGLPFYGY